MLLDGTATLRAQNAMTFTQDIPFVGGYPGGQFNHGITAGWTQIVESEIKSTFRNGNDWEKHPLITLSLVTPP